MLTLRHLCRFLSFFFAFASRHHHVHLKCLLSQLSKSELQRICKWISVYSTYTKSKQMLRSRNCILWDHLVEILEVESFGEITCCGLISHLNILAQHIMQKDIYSKKKRITIVLNNVMWCSLHMKQKSLYSGEQNTFHTLDLDLDIGLGHWYNNLNICLNYLTIKVYIAHLRCSVISQTNWNSWTYSKGNI